MTASLAARYDISKPCTTLNEDLCYPETKAIGAYLDQPWVRAKLGAAEQVGPFQSCSDKVGLNFALSRDALAPTFFHLAGLLENGVRVLIYVGQLDWICGCDFCVALVMRELLCQTFQSAARAGGVRPSGTPLGTHPPFHVQRQSTPLLSSCGLLARTPAFPQSFVVV